VYKLVINYHKKLRSPDVDSGEEQIFLFLSKSKLFQGLIHPPIEKCSRHWTPRAGLAVLVKSITIFSLLSGSWISHYSETAMPGPCRIEVPEGWNHNSILTCDFMLWCIIKCSDLTLTSIRRLPKPLWFVNTIPCRKVNRCACTTPLIRVIQPCAGCAVTYPNMMRAKACAAIPRYRLHG
jgi:hypothetical protein